MKSTLELRLLGTPKISLAGQPLAEALPGKAQAVLYYLAMTGQRQSRTALATLLWGDLPETAARTNLRKTLAHLRQVLGDYLELDHQEIGFKSKEQLWVDAVEFEALMSSLLQQPERPTDIQQLQAVVNLYGGDFLTGFYVLHAPDFESWMLAEQARLRELMVQALQALADSYAGQEAWPAGLACLRRLLSLEPWREEAHRQLMLLLAYNGQRSAALAQFETCRRALEEELGVEPEPETVTLYEHIREGKIGPKAAEPASTLQGGPQAGSEPAPLSSFSDAPRFVYNLPTPSTPFVGRATELADILRRLTDKACRLLTLVGPGGIGKTRLALQAAQAFVEPEAPGAGFFPQGIVFVSLVEISSAGSMVSAIAKAANFTFYNNGTPRQQLLNYLRGKKMLLILDNLEHLLEEAAPLILEILAAAPEVKILVTSREALNLQEAWFHPVEGMSFPDELETQESTLEKYDAVQLFVQSARRVRVEFSLAEEQAHVVQICRLVEGMPLGIELAAAWLKVLPAAKIVQEIEKGLEILTTRLRNMPERHHSIRAVFEQSWQLLTAEEQAVLQQLSVFRGSFTEEAAEYVARASLLNLAVLVEKSLVRATEDGQYQMHELLRQFSGAKLASDPQAEAVTRERHSAYYLGFLKAREERMTGPDQQQALLEIGEVIENIRSAWRWAVEQGYLAAIDQAVHSLYNFYQIRSRYQEGLEIFEKAVKDLQASPLLIEHPEGEIVLNRLLARWGGFHFFLGAYETAYDYLEAALSSANQPQEKEFILYLLGDVAVALGKRDLAKAWFSQSLALSRERGDLQGVADGLRGLGYVASSFGDFVEGKQFALESLAICRQLGQPLQLARSLASLAWATNCLGEYREAERYWQESLAICQEIGDRWGTANSLSLLGWSAWCEGGERLAEAIPYYKEALAICQEIGYRRDVAMCLGDLALAAGEMGEYKQAVQYGQAGLATAEEINHLDMTIYNLYCLGAAACGLDDFQTGRKHLLKSIKLAKEGEVSGHLTSALFYLATLLVKESEVAGMAEPLKTRQKAKALELLYSITAHPACWQAIKDRAVPLQAQLAAELPPDEVAAARTRVQERLLETLVTEILSEAPTDFENP